MKLLMADIGDRIDVDCPPAQQGFPSEMEPEEAEVEVGFPMLENIVEEGAMREVAAT